MRTLRRTRCRTRDPSNYASAAWGNMQYPATNPQGSTNGRHRTLFHDTMRKFDAQSGSLSISLRPCRALILSAPRYSLIAWLERKRGEHLHDVCPYGALLTGLACHGSTNPVSSVSAEGANKQRSEQANKVAVTTRRRHLKFPPAPTLPQVAE